MELIHYLNDGFFTRQKLLAASAINLSELEDLQKRGIMPQASYTLKLDVSCNSFFGPHQEQSDVAYYAKEYVAWIGEMRALSGDEALKIFAQRYKARLQQLQASGITTQHEKLNAGLDAHLISEWKYFLDGVYGLCTKSGLPEDIAAKEVAVVIIKEITEERLDKDLSSAELSRLKIAVDLLDAASTPFAPHEVLRSSRHRLIDQVRSAYHL
jgi:hypothetical protein